MKAQPIKLLAISLLALAGIIATSAPAAQAKWLLLLDETSVSILTLLAEVSAGELAVPELGIGIACTGGMGNTTASLEESGKRLSGSGSMSFTGCDLTGAEEVCEVFSPGQPDGTIIASGSGVAEMIVGEPETVLSEIASAEFTILDYGGEECPMTSLSNMRILGEAILTLSGASKDATEHSMHLDDKAFFYGDKEMVLQSAEEAAIPGHVTDANDPTATWAIHLVEL